MKSITKQERWAFIGALASGFVSQGMGLTNKYAFSDDLNHMFDSGVTIQSGRGGLYILSLLEKLLYGNGQYAVPTYNGSLAILALACTVCVLVRFFDIRDSVLAAILGALWTAFPSLTALMYFDFTVHLYMIGLLIGVCGVYLVCKSNRILVVISGVLLMGISVGVYQAFLPVFVCMILLDLIRIFEMELIETTSRFWAKVGIRLGALIGALGFYYLLNELLLWLCHESYTGYMGIGSELEVPLKTYLIRATVAIREFFAPRASYNETSIYVGNTRYLYILLVILLIVMCWIYCRTVWNNLKLPARIGMILCMVLIPLSVNMMWVLSSYRILRMEYSLVTFYLVLIFLADNIKLEEHGKLKTTIYLATLLMCISLARIDNISYLKTTFIQSEATQYFNTLIASIRNTDGYRDEYPVLFINSGNKTDMGLKTFDEFSGIPEDPRRDLEDYLNDFMWQDYVATWCGYYPTVLSETEIIESDMISGMSSYPDKGSIAVVNDVVVVKF